MEIKHKFKPNDPTSTMLNKIAKLLPLLTLVIAAPSFADDSYPSHRHRHGQIAAGEMGRHMDDLNLTPEQKTKVEALRAATKTQMDTVFTPEQRQQRDRMRAERQARPAGEKGMNLTPDQKVKIKAIRDANKEQFKAILTPAQQAQLAQGGGWGKGNQLNLTPEQKVKMEQLRASAKTQMKAVLTPDQQQQVQDRQGGLKAMNLTADQKVKIKTIMESSDRQLDAILTPEQQAKRKSHRQGGWRKNG